MVRQLWQVVGGSEAGGVVAREGCELTSRRLDSRLATGAFVDQVELKGERLHYRRLSGDGPNTGWVSLKFKGSALLARTEALSPEAAATLVRDLYPDLPDTPMLPRKSMPALRLPSGGQMPMSGLGLQHGRSTAVGQLARANVYEYLMLGGRHLDCAVAYENNQWVGEGVAAAIRRGVPREEIFLSVKFAEGWWGNTSPMFKCPALLKELAVEYIDMLMIHFPFVPGPEDPPQKQVHQDTWKAMDRMRVKGLARDLGVSNFGVEQMKEIMELGLSPITANELEYHPWCPGENREVVGWCQARGIACTAYCSAEPITYLFSTERLGFPRVTNWATFRDRPGREADDYGPEWLYNDVNQEIWSFQKPTPEHYGEAWTRMEQIAASHKKSMIQVILRWTVQKGVCVIPGSRHHMAENLELFDWTLSDEDMEFLTWWPGGVSSYRTPFGPDTLR